MQRFVLGTAQLGMSYGINNVLGQPSVQASEQILSAAYSAGVRFLDTADVYGQSSDVLGKIGVENFKVLSKFTSLNQQGSVRASLESTLRRLNLKSLECYSFHRFQDFATFKNWQEIIELKQEGLISKLGISIYSNEEFDQALENPHIDLIQLPFNVLDNWTLRGELIQRAVTARKSIHVRSIFLQGLFFLPVEKIPDSLQSLKPALLKIQELASESNLTVAELCLGYVLSKTEIEGLVIGLESVSQLQSNVLLFHSVKLSQSTIESIESLRVPNQALLHPGNWK